MLTLRPSLLPNESIYFQTKKHFIIFFMPLIWTLLTWFFFSLDKPLIPFSGVHLPIPNTLQVLAFFPGVMAVLAWLNQGLSYLTSQFTVTNHRIIMREGFFFRHSTETRLTTVAEVKINQSLLGQLFNYGTVIINSYGGGAEVFESIAAPATFQFKVSQLINKT